MKKSIGSVFLTVVFLMVLLSGCAPASTSVAPALAPSPISSSPTETSGSNGNIIKLSPAWLVTADEINSLSKDIEVVQWELIDELAGENAIRHTFKGTSWSSNPNEALNSIIKISPGSTFEDVIKSLFDSGYLLAGAVPVKSSLSFDSDFAVYAGKFPNGHSVYDLLLVKQNLFYWASVSLGTPVGNTPESLYESNREVIDAFLSNLIMINLDRSK